MKRDLRATWPQALWTFLMPILLLLSVRWLLIEPFVIPSGSMVPTLLIHDHIFVNKLAFGIKIPFSKKFLWQWQHPEKSQVVVFRYPENPEVFYVKRILATGGDEIAISNGIVSINGQPLEQRPVEKPNWIHGEVEEFDYWNEMASPAKSHIIRFRNRELSQFPPTKVPEGSFFVMGDNRDQSNDSRFWGFVPEENLIGTAQRVWLSCEHTLSSAQFICDPQTLRWDRVLKKVE